MNYALINDGIATTVTTVDRPGYVPVPDHVQAGWELDGEAWRPGTALRHAEIDAAASAHIASAINGPKQAEALMRALLVLHDDLQNLLSQPAREALAPLRALGEKVAAVHAHRDALKADPTKTAADADFPAI